ncbi:MAG: hypothetical protein ACOYIE_07750 [Agathobaculum sp.]|jgi:hypothetical protein|uniref:hypothetical protein n=1 Tax=Agathobaculum sp. TaxID=2048138 RepID=UPI003D940390
MTNEKFYEVLGGMDENYVKEAGEYRKRKPVWPKWCAAAACLCLAVLGLWFAGQRTDGQTPGGVVPQPEGGVLTVNPVENVTSADMDVQFSHYSDLPADGRQAAEQAFADAMGMTCAEFAAKLPADWQQTAFYSVDAPTEPRGAVYIPHDYVFELRTADGGSAKIALCAGQAPLRDCFFVCDAPEQSEIGGTAVTVYGVRDTLFAEFACGGVFYDVETHGVPAEELENLLTGLLA